MKILVTGSSGLIGSLFLSDRCLINNRNNILLPKREILDISNEKQCEEYIKTHKPDIIVNFAAFRDANTAELQRENTSGEVWRTNVNGVKNITDLSNKVGSFLIHISSDMVFAGSIGNKGPYNEMNLPEIDDNKLTWYGVSKKYGEEYIKLNCKKYAIIRIGNVTHSLEIGKLDYVGKILSLYKEENLYPMFNDQYLTLTYVPHLFKLIDSISRSKEMGVFHVSSKQRFTPFELALYLIKGLNYDAGRVRLTSIKLFLKKHPRRYPQHGGLNSSLTEKKVGLNFGTWKNVVDEMIKNYEKKKN